jgi:hypothetical protein
MVTTALAAHWYALTAPLLPDAARREAELTRLAAPTTRRGAITTPCSTSKTC